MSSQTGRDRFDWRRAVVGGLASGVMAASLVAGFGASTASAQPADPATPSATDDNCTGDDCSKDDAAAAAAAAGCDTDDKKCADAAAEPKRVNADQVLAQINAEYSQGDGGGQISKLIDDAMKLRAQGFRPSSANATALTEALEHRPNQTPLVEALKATLNYQRKLQAQQAMNTQQQGPIAGPVPIMMPQGSMNVPIPVG
jgi:hypothetical protein